MRVRWTEELVDALRAIPKLAESAFDAEEWPAVENRMDALDALLDGSSVTDVSTRFCLDRKTVARLRDNSVERGVDGKPLSYRACVPMKRIAPATPQGAQVPVKAHAFAFEMTVRAVSGLSDKLNAFRGALPTRSTPSPAFNRLYASISKLLIEGGYSNHYPLNTSDGGRRALQEYLKRLRARREAEEGAERPEAPSITRVEHLFTLQPFDRFEFDEHSMDVDAWFALPLTDGSYQLSHVNHLWLLDTWDAATGAGVAGSLVVGTKYNSDDVCDHIAKVLQPWAPRELVIPTMRYSERAWMPGMMAVDAIAPRSLVFAMDNDASHVGNMTLANVTDHRMGITHCARAGNAEARAVVEARHKRIENELFRYLAGGFIPETDHNDKIIVSTLNGERYPIYIEALEDLVDIYLSASNVSDRSTRDPRSPKFLTEQYAASGALLWRCPNTLDQIRRMTIRRMNVRVSGSKREKVPPLVYCDYARYRSPQLSGQWSLIGRSFKATYEKPFDIRELTLWDEGGEKLFTLHALPPYSQVPHAFNIRQRAAAWARAMRARPHKPGELTRVLGDNVVSYMDAVRKDAATHPWASGLIARGQVPARGAQAPAIASPESPLAGFRPLSGAFRRL
jgi:putative transposase